jgi:hypothetical protein
VGSTGSGGRGAGNRSGRFRRPQALRVNETLCETLCPAS